VLLPPVAVWLTSAVCVALCAGPPFASTAWSTVALFDVPVCVMLQSWTAASELDRSKQRALLFVPLCTTVHVSVSPTIEPVPVQSTLFSPPAWSTRFAVVQFQPLPGQCGPA